VTDYPWDIHVYNNYVYNTGSEGITLCQYNCSATGNYVGNAGQACLGCGGIIQALQVTSPQIQLVSNSVIANNTVWNDSTVGNTAKNPHGHMNYCMWENVASGVYGTTSGFTVTMTNVDWTGNTCGGTTAPGGTPGVINYGFLFTNSSSCTGVMPPCYVAQLDITGVNLIGNTIDQATVTVQISETYTNVTGSVFHGFNNIYTDSLSLPKPGDLAFFDPNSGSNGSYNLLDAVGLNYNSGTDTLTIGVAGTSTGTLSLAGSTSGTATFTAPAVAGTTTNPVVSSNNISAPALVSTVATGTAPLQVTSTTNVPNLNASSLNGNTLSAPTQYGIAYGSTSTNYATTAALTANALIKAGSSGPPLASVVLDNGTMVSTTEPFISSTYNTCPDTTGSGTAQSCNTTPTFTVVTGSCVIYTTTTANTGTGLTVNVNSLGAKSVAIGQSSTTLAANVIQANKESLLCYDGANWELGTIGTALPVALGGTSLASGTAGGVLGFTATGTIASSALLAANAIVQGGGSSATPSTGNGDFTLDLTAHTLKSGANGLVDFSAITATTGFKVPAKANNTATAAGVIDYDNSSSANNLHANVNSVDSIILAVPAASLPSTNVVPKYIVSSSNVTQGSSSITDNAPALSSTDTTFTINSNNTSQLLCANGAQSAVTLTATSSLQSLITCSIPSALVATGHMITPSIIVRETTGQGTYSVSYELTLGSSSSSNVIFGPTTTGSVAPAISMLSMACIVTGTNAENCAGPSWIEGGTSPAGVASSAFQGINPAATTGSTTTLTLWGECTTASCGGSTAVTVEQFIVVAY